MKRLFALMCLCLSGSLACQLTDDVQDAVDTISRSVALLQEISESGTWTYTTEGLNVLTQQGYAATVDIQQGTTNPTGDTLTAVSETLRWEISADTAQNSRVLVTDSEGTREYITYGQETYRVENGNYICVGSGNSGEGGLFGTSASDAFTTYSATALGVQAISVAEESGTETINDFATTRYQLVSKLDEALEILAEFPSAELQSEIENVPEFYIDGALHIDNATGALIRFEAAYADLERLEGNRFTFNVTQVGNQPMIQAPDPARITVPCTTPGATATP